MLVPIEELRESTQRFKSFADDPKVIMDVQGAFEDIGDEKTDEPVKESVRKGNILGDAKNRVQRREMIESFSLEPTDFALERTIGENDSVYSNFIDLINNVKQKIGRIVVKDGVENKSYATGFMISDELLMTNWHVFKEKDSVANSQVEFHYELDHLGNSKDPITFNFNPDAFFHSFRALDYCIVAVNKMDVTKSHTLGSIGYIYLNPTSGKLGDEHKESLNIIHHPNGDYKQLSIRENLFTKIMETTIWYESDTAQGSSGAPVFNDQWQIVALHHMGVPKRNDQGDYLDKNNNIIPVIDKKIDVSRIHWIANEGIRISVILKDLKLKFETDNPYLLGIEKDSQQNNSPLPPKTKITSDMKRNESQVLDRNSENINISFPQNILDRHGKIDISFSVRGHGKSNIRTSIDIDEIDVDPILEESKKLERSMDYTHCKGYQSDFLGTDVPMPLPQETFKHRAALISGTDSYILNYYKFSVIQNAIKKMPFISAINVDGNEDKRKDVTKRKDKWIRDNRIDYDVQLDNTFYTKSGFDRGHMSRREDANWGKTPEEAKRNADLTCVHTNACPQVPALNRSNRKGLWGKLEKVILERGAVKENEETNKITVFSGPIFKESNPAYKGVQIPTEYYKIILWLNDDGELRATAFVLSQVDLMEGINLEAIDLDKNVEFKQHMRSIKSLHELTGINFSHLFDFDTFKGSKNEEIEIDSVEVLLVNIEPKS